MFWPTTRIVGQDYYNLLCFFALSYTNFLNWEKKTKCPKWRGSLNRKERSLRHFHSLREMWRLYKYSKKETVRYQLSYGNIESFSVCKSTLFSFLFNFAIWSVIAMKKRVDNEFVITFGKKVYQKLRKGRYFTTPLNTPLIWNFIWNTLAALSRTFRML